MADQNKPESADNFFNEILSPCELFAARSRSHKIPARGQKDFYPDDSEEQKQRLQQRLDEHWSLISEERVERLGNLVKAVWSPSERIVELQTPAGKFWQTMGFSAEGKQFLLPEEALYLMECGNLQVFHQDLPLSIQDGYEAFLSSDSVSLQQYQVFGHLKRLGYVVHRFDPSSEPSPYARQLNLPRSRDCGGRQLKRKRSPSPTPTSSKTAAASQAEEMEEEDKLPESHLVASAAPQTSSSGAAGEVQARTWWPAEVPERQAGQRSAPGSQRWDFSSICFPDLGSAGRLAPLDASLLPGGVTPGVCDIAPWMRRINLRKVKMSPKEEERERRQRRRDVNKDKEVQRCRNWAEYHKLLERRQAKRQGRPAHLWSGEVQPLHDPTRPISTAELLEKISVIKSTDLLEGAARLKGLEEWRICFNVYQPDSVADFKKSNPGKPYARMCVCSFDGPVPDLRVIKQLSFQSGDVPVVYAAVDHGDISFYTFKDFQLPRDVYP
ncbi:tRNA-splicing endonuclease subunit Sen54 isoform X1 [Xiphophorus hellerii]|uniref:tRNA-splicing endonuclease subunit Sen54 isoform X1 n=2 Tax=Xiphophorus hellerii TaxID=8084 RepID=UPI0013B39A7C|nr:tRNA-splicing endonuclease subunit Sen54 isoform X1 [Xiphophorus hellerii]